MKNSEYIISTNILKDYDQLLLDFSLTWENDYIQLDKYFNNTFNIISSIDKDIIRPYFKDWSNMPGNAQILVKPKNEKECSIILKTCHLCKIPVTISAGQTNLTGSATPNKGLVLSTSLLTSPDIYIDNNLMHVLSPVGIPLEKLRNQILKISKNQLYYPVDPTSRHDAFVGGTISCNASGFIPGEKGATRYWVKEISFILPNGDFIKAKKGQYISSNGYFKLSYNNKEINIPIPRYKRPNIKNASGLFSSEKGEIDFIDLIIGSEGILGLVSSCVLGLQKTPKDYLELFLCLKSENQAIDFHDFLYKYFNQDLSKISALEYFGYNSQKYMKNKNFLFDKSTDVGVYLQIPIYDGNIESKGDEWIFILSDFDNSLDINNIIVLNDPINWKKFFEARHSIPDNALRTTKSIGGMSIITDTIVPPENYKLYLKKVHSKLQKSKIEYLLFGHLGDCHLHFHLIPSKSQHNLSLEIYDYLIDLSSKLGGVYSAEHGTGKRKRNDFKKCFGKEAILMIQLLKKKIDPYFLLNRGNIVTPI